MRDSKETALKTRILKGVKKHLSELVDEMVALGAERAKVSQLLFDVKALVDEESKLQVNRKQLSRRIGQAKKANESAQGLIAEVSQISEQLAVLDRQLTQNIASVQSMLALDTANQVIDGVAWPQHFQWVDDKNSPNVPDIDDCLVECDAPVDPGQWQEFVESIPHATIYHDPRWQVVLQRTFKHKVHVITCKDRAGQLLGVLPLTHLNSGLFGSFTISMPYFNYGGPLANSSVVEELLMVRAAQLSEELGCSHMEIRETRQRKNWQGVQRKVSMVLPLPKSDEALDKKLGSKLRAQINKARSHQLRVEFGGIEKVDDFYTVFSRNMRDLGTPVYSKAIFADVLSTFKDSAFLCIVYMQNTPLAAGFLLGYRDKLEIPWASSIRQQNHLGANMLMYRCILAEAIDRGYGFFDFGRSSKGANTYKFKKQWGAIEHSLYWHYWTKDSQGVPEINPDNKKYHLMIKVWQNLPVPITKIIGPPVARCLP